MATEKGERVLIRVCVCVCVFVFSVCVCVFGVCMCVVNMAQTCTHGPNLYILVRDVTQRVNFGQFMDCPGRSMDPCLEQAIHGFPAVPSPAFYSIL